MDLFSVVQLKIAIYMSVSAVCQCVYLHRCSLEVFEHQNTKNCA